MTRLIVKLVARDDVLRQVRYLLEQDAVRAATRFPSAFQKALDRIVQFPKIGAPRKLRSAELKHLRSWPIPGFKSVRVYYIATRSVVRVLRVLHDRQDLEQLFLRN
jgi:plasmid stabilization system protein ParE